MLEPEAEGRPPRVRFIVVGGGPTGVEMAGALSELIRLVLVKDYPRLNIKDVRILLLEATDRLLPALPERLREAAGKTLWRKYVEVRFGASVADYDGRQARLKSGEVIPAQTVIWAAGVRASPLNATLGLPTARQGRIPVEPTLQLKEHPEVFIIGDAAYREQDGEALPMVAPVAIQMGQSVALNIRRQLRGQPLQPVPSPNQGTRATIARNPAVAKVAAL